MALMLGMGFAAVLGLVFGSFLNVCLSRWPAGESIVSPGSHCRACDHALSWWENVPLASWLALRGRCRKCRAPISWRYPLVELAVCVLWTIVAWRSFDAFLPLEFAAGMMIFTWALVGLAVLDAEYLWLPDAITLPAIALGFCWWFLRGEQVGWTLNLPAGRWADAKAAGGRLVAILAAAGLILLIRWVYWLIRRKEGIGLGDAKLMAMLGAWLGLPGALLAFALGVALGAAVAAILLVLPGSARDGERWPMRKLPLGTFLCVGGAVSSLWGKPMIDAYLRWSGF